MKKKISSGWIFFICFIHIGISEAVLPPAGLGTVPFDHDKFLQFAESNRADTVASGDAYYQTIDPDNLRTTIDDWKALNGFVEPLPNTTAGLAAMGISHTLYRNATDLGFIRNIYIRVKANGDVVALLENFPGFERTINLSFDEVADGCSSPFDPGLPKEQRCTSGGIDGFETRDLSGVLASVVMEYSAVKPGGPKFTQFYGYGNDGTRVSALDLTGRGKAEAFPGLCAVCHGGSPGGIDQAGKFIPPDLAYAGAEDGNFGSGFLPFDPDLYEFHDPDGAGAEVGSGTYSRANQEAFYKELNRLVLDTDPTPTARELVEGWYGGAGLPGAFDGHFVPVGWAGSPEDTAFYETVLAPYCRACHIQRAFPESTVNKNAQISQLDFNHENDLDHLLKQVGNTVFSRTTMPLALVTYDKFWNDSAAVTNLIDYLDYRIKNLIFYSADNSYTEILPTEDDGAGNLIAVMPGKPVANPGSYINQVVGQSLQLDGSLSLSADNYAWSVLPAIGVTLTNQLTATPTFNASIPGTYTVTLTVSNDEKTDSAGVTRPADTSVPVSTMVNVVSSPFSRITFDSSIKNSQNNARCLQCHSEPDAAGFEEFNFYFDFADMSELEEYSFVQGNYVSRLLYKSAGLLTDFEVRHGIHGGGKILREDDAYFALLKNWIEDGECENETACQRISVTNEDTALEIDPLSPFMDKSLSVALVGRMPAHGALSLTAEQQLLYTPEPGFTGLDSYFYLLTDLTTGLTRRVMDEIYVFPDLGLIPGDFSEPFSDQFSSAIPDIDSQYEFEKVNADGDALPNYLDDFPNNPLISRDHDGDGIPDAFNANISSEQASSSGIFIDPDDDNDGVADAGDAFPLDSTSSVYSDSDKDGVADAIDPFPVDMLSTSFEDFESGNLSAISWVTSGNAPWSVVPQTETPYHPLTGNFSAKSPLLNDNESAGLSVSLTVATGHVSFWYFLSSEGCCDELIFDIDGAAQFLGQTNEWTRVSFPVTAGTHVFTWTYAKDSSISAGFDAAWIDAIGFSGPADGDVDGASDALDNCPATKNTDQSDVDADGIGDACDANDSDGDGIADVDEVAGGSNPAVKDSDGDGVNDGVDAFSSDAAASIDSDGDGYPDALVPAVDSTSLPPLLLDLDPSNPRGAIDSDGDGILDNTIYTIAGTGVNNFSGDGGLATAAELNSPKGLAVDAAGDLFIADSTNNRIRRVDATTGIITTIAGTGAFGFGGDGGLATAAEFRSPNGLVFDAAGNLFIADSSNNKIRRVDAATGIITTVAGTGAGGFSGDGGLATAAELNLPRGLAIDAAGNLFIADIFNNRVRRVDAATGLITTMAGTGAGGFSGDGGLATAAELDFPEGLAIDAAGNLFIADSANNRIRRVDAATGIITTVAAAELNSPKGLAVDAAGDLFIADSTNNRIRRVDTATGFITTVAGTVAGNVAGSFGGDGDLATAAKLNFPQGLAMDAAGNLFISTTTVVRQVTLVSTPDAFPFDPAASIDTDGDGFPDNFNAGATAEQIAASGLIIDAFPNDPTAVVDTDGDGLPDYFILSGGLISPPSLSEDFDDDDDSISDVDEIIAGTNPQDADSDKDTIPDALDELSGRDPLVANWLVSAGGLHACALDDSDVVCWGDNTFGQRIVPPLSTPVTVTAGGDHSCALDDSGVVCWGDNAFGQLMVPSLSNPVAVIAGNDHNCALDDSGVVCWGDNVFGQSAAPALSNPAIVSGGFFHSCALDDSGVQCWGDDTFGERTVPALSNPVAVSAGGQHSCALDDSGVVCWGDDTHDQLMVPSLSNPVAVSAGGLHSCALDDSGVVCWGRSAEGQSTVPSLSNPVVVSAGLWATCVLDDSGVVCWGRSAEGQITVPVLAFDKDLDGLLDSQEDVNGNGLIDAGETSSVNPDSDGDGVSDGEEVNILGTDPLNDDVRPVLTVPADIVVDAIGPFTVVPFGTGSAVDFKDGEVPAVLNDPGPLPPGRHFIIWTATDAAGNGTFDTQRVDVIPLVNFVGATQFTPEDVTAHVELRLNGNAVNYPVSVPFTVSGSASPSVDYALASGSIDLGPGNVATIDIPILNGGAGEPEETIVLTMGTPVNAVAGSASQHTVRIVETNIAPRVDLTLEQATMLRAMVITGDGDVRLSANTGDPNPGDTHSFDWTATDGTLVPIEGHGSSTFTFDPSGLDDGLFVVSVTVTDDGSPAEQATASRLIRVATIAPTLLPGIDSDGDGIDDLDEGLSDSNQNGISDYRERSTADTLLPVDTTMYYQVLQAPEGISLQLGGTAVGRGDGARVTQADIANFGNDGAAALNAIDAAFDYSMGIFNFELSGLTTDGDSVPVVVPLLGPVPEGGFYRKYRTNLGWQNFVEDANNNLASAIAADGVCPAPGSVSYVSGLVPGSHCVQLTIEDGGPNDGDGAADRKIRDPGGLAELTDLQDTDADTVPDALDNCVLKANTDQRDTDGDDYGNVCDPDLNNDGLVTVTDFLILRGRLNGTDADADFNGDGVVTVTDFLILRGFLNQVPGPSALAL